jgi:hypothetical protein
MRWIYLDASNSQEAAEYAAVVRRIDAWWEAFVAKSDAIGELFARRSDWDLPAWMDRHFHAISRSLMWEYGPAVTGKGHRLVITPERKKYLRPIVQTVLERAPKLAGWEFYPYRLPESVEMAGQMVATRARGDLRGTLATAMIGNHNRIDLRFILRPPPAAMTSRPSTMRLSPRRLFSASRFSTSGSVLLTWGRCESPQRSASV